MGPGGFGRWRPSNGGEVSLHKVFDDKVVISSDYAYSGDKGGEQWRVRTRGYWISKCPALLKAIDWAERRDDQAITMQDIVDESVNGQWHEGLDVEKVGEVLGGFLNMSLKGEAHRTFELAPLLNGLEAWRIVVQGIHRGRDNRHAALRKMVRSLPAIHRLEDVDQGITSFDNTLRKYEACGGQRPGDDDLKTDLLDSLPAEIRENLLWRTVKKEPYETF